MAETTFDLDSVFAALSDPTRRDTVDRHGNRSIGVGAIPRHCGPTYAGLARRRDVLEHASIVHVRITSKQRVVTIEPGVLTAADNDLKTYRLLREAWID